GGGGAGQGTGFGGRPGAPGRGAPPGGGRPGGPGGRGGRGRGGTQGAFGRPGGGRPVRGRKSRKQRRQEFDNMEAPTIGGVRIPRGDGATIRLSRGASLADLAEKIDVNPASLVQVRFGLGAQVTDIVILVVAADDGVMPQTIEALNHAQAAEVPIVVAVNKVDKEDANPAKVRQQLTEYGLVAEEYGGETMFVDVSARARTGIDDLLEAVLLTADAALDLRANPNQDAQGIAIEAHLDRGRGPVATVLVQRGTLRPGDSIVAGDAFGRVRAMLDENGDTVDEAPPARPVQVLGLTSVPGAGDSFLVVSEDRVARQIAQRREARERSALFAQRRPRVTLEDLESALKSGEREELLLIIKGDVSGSAAD